MNNSYEEQRLVPRFPLPKEKIKFIFEEGEKVFAVRDISLVGVGISLLEFGESVMFPEGYRCQAELKLDEPFVVNVQVARVNAWSVGFRFEGMPEESQEKIRSFIDPLHIGLSLKRVVDRAAPEAFLHGMSDWFHGDSGTDLFLWKDSRGGLNRVMFCSGKSFWEWQEGGGVSTGEMERLDGDKVALHRDATPNPKTRTLVRKVLEHAQILDYRLVSFLKDQT